jgi:hypothetical protein
VTSWRPCAGPDGFEQKYLPEVFDPGGGLGYKRRLEGMMFRCSSSMVLAVLIGGGGCLWSALPARAGERIEFSAPAIPLNVPRQEVEIKDEPSPPLQRGIRRTVMSQGPLPSSSVIIVGSPKARAKASWDSTAPGDDKDDDSRTRDSFAAPNLLTNDLDMPRGWGSSRINGVRDERSDNGEAEVRRFGAFNNNGATQNESRLGKGNHGDIPSWLRALGSHEPAALSWGESGARGPYMVGAAGSGAGANNSRTAADLWHGLGEAPGLDKYSTSEANWRRDSGEQAGGLSLGEMRAWDRQSFDHQELRSHIPPIETGRSRVVAPNNPVNLPMPKRPNDPF